MLLTCDTFWPTLFSLRNQEITSLGVPYQSVLVILFSWKYDYDWFLKPGMCIPQTLWRSHPQKPFLVHKQKSHFGQILLAFHSWKEFLLLLQILKVSCYQSGRRFEFVGGLGGWRQATHSQGGSWGAAVKDEKVSQMTFGLTTLAPGLIPFTGQCDKVLLGAIYQLELSSSTTYVSVWKPYQLDWEENSLTSDLPDSFLGSPLSFQKSFASIATQCCKESLVQINLLFQLYKIHLSFDQS